MSARSFGATTGAMVIQTFATRILITVLGVATGIVVARALGPAGKGAYSAVQVLLSVPLAVTGGAAGAITFVLTKERWSVRDLFPVFAITFGAATIATVAGACIYGALHGWNEITTAFALAAPAAVILSMQPNYFIGSNRLGRLNKQTTGLAIATLAAVCVALYLLHAGLRGALAAWTICMYGGAAIVLLDMVRSGGRWHLEAFAQRLRTFVKIGSASSLNTALGTINYRVDSFVLVALLGLAPFGIYSIAVSVGEALFLLSRPISTAVSREIGASGATRSADLTAATIRLTFAITAIVAVFVFLAAPPLIQVMYGGRFAAAVLPLRVLLPGIIAFSSAGTFASFFIFQLGRPLTVAAINALMIAAQVAACIAFVPRYGMAGAAAGSTLTYFIGAGLNTWIFCKRTGVHASALWLLRASDLQRMRTICSELLPLRGLRRAWYGR